MKKQLFACLICLVNTAIAQLPGDTIKVKTFHYKSNTRDTIAAFPSGNLTYEKIIMKYNMRCKNALVSDGTDRNKGCGEWDYSCNTYIVDSSKIEEETNTTPNYKISNFTGTTFNYTNKPLYDYYDYAQKSVTLNTIISENQYTIGTGNTALTKLLKADEKSGKTFVLYTAAQLIAAGLSAGNIDAIMLNAANTGDASFFKLKLKHTAQNILNANAPDLTGFTEVYNHAHSFAIGSNRIQFYTPFTWNGTSNILIEISFTNASPSSPIVLSGFADTASMCLYANNQYALDLSSNAHVLLDASVLSSINKELTVSFWAYGNTGAMPTETSILYGYGTNANERQLNIHLPWSNNTIYFDCGYTAGGFDRIEKTATAAEQAGQWQHWTFTKNATTGSMKIYLNGTLWHSGTSKTKNISLLALILGKNSDFTSNYKGKIMELSIWNKEISAATILSWINKPIDNTHTNFSNLVAYYKMNEGAGQTIKDVKNNLSVTGTNFQWQYERGDKLNKLFIALNQRPNITFLQGTYNLSIANTSARDSIARNTNTVEQYSIISKAGEMPIKHDVVNLVNTTYLYEAIAQKIVNGDNGTQISTIPVTSTGSIAITNLNYIKRYPFYNEIMSFVTPFGIGLNFGINGKSWYYDVTDFTPLLKNNKRIMMTLGGQNQEQMDVEFYFIVGTPVRNVLNFNQLWQGAARTGGISIGSINNQTKFTPITFNTNSQANAFKIRSTITGHGQEGEFSQSGGLIDHQLIINGGFKQYTWNITQECAFNPVYPQGGTWVYDRQGWCPGESSLLKEFDITKFVAPGVNNTIDYNTSQPQNANGDYRFIAAHQLVSYAAPNHSIDASVTDILSPTDKILYGRKNAICANPVIKIQNTGATNLTSVRIEYWVNNSTNVQDFTWTGNLAFMETAEVTLPTYFLFTKDMLAKGNVFNVELKKANNTTDNYALNNKMTSLFGIPDVATQNFIIELKTNNNPAENNFKLYDHENKLIDAQTFTTANKTHTFSYNLNGCFKLVVEDTEQDGLNWWASAAQGTGFVRIKKGTGAIIKTFNPDFGGGFEYNFTTNWALGIQENIQAQNIDIYPNPNNGVFTIEGLTAENTTIKIIDILGKQINFEQQRTDNKIQLNTQNISAGVYSVIIKQNNEVVVKKVVVY